MATTKGAPSAGVLSESTNSLLRGATGDDSLLADSMQKLSLASSLGTNGTTATTMAPPELSVEHVDAATTTSTTSAAAAAAAAAQSSSSASNTGMGMGYVDDDVQAGGSSSSSAGVAQSQSQPQPKLKLKPGDGGRDEGVATTQMDAREVASDMAQLANALERATDTIFRIQELRHATAESGPAADNALYSALASPPRMTAVRAAAPATSGSVPSSTDAAAPPPPPPPAGDAPLLSEVDRSLVALDTELEAARALYDGLQAHFDSLAPAATTTATGSSNRQFTALKQDWHALQTDAGLLVAELNEDKYLTVFRTVAAQARDMMHSLDKALNRANVFIADPSSAATSSSPSSSSSVAPNTTAAAFTTLQQNLRQKLKYYAPACRRVLAILDRGVAERKTQNGEVLRTLADMKTRWRSLQDEIAQTEREMASLEARLALDTAPKTSDGLLTPPRHPPTAIPGSAAGRVSPLRKLAAKLSRSPPASEPSSSPPRSRRSSALYGSTRVAPNANSRPSTSATALADPSPPRPPKSAKRFVSTGDVPQATTPAARPPMPPTVRGHRSTMSVDTLGTSTPLRSSTRPRISAAFSSSAATPRRSYTPALLENDAVETLSDELQPPRAPFANDAGSRRMTPGFRSASRNSMSGLTPRANSSLGFRSSSRLSMSVGAGGMRAASPAFSDAQIRDRPETPSRIPAPASATRRSSALFGRAATPSHGESEGVRSPSPTPSASASVTSSTARRKSSGLPRRISQSSLGASTSSLGGLSPPRVTSPPQHWRSHTPEPNLIANARRVAGLYGGLDDTPERMTRSTRETSPLPPVPPVPSAYRDSAVPPSRPLRSQRRPSVSSSVSGAPSSSSRMNSNGGRMSLARSTTPLSFASSAGFDERYGGVADYVPNPHDPLDVEVARIISGLVVPMHVERLDPPLARRRTRPAELVARYSFSLGALASGMRVRTVHCKLVERPGGAHKILVRTGGGYMDLESFALNIIAQSVSQ